ncbi:SnoaL-like domain-containing protein [Polaribacter sp. KT25b]|uniref:nuclear transport factor 2 family protein n=1 Tax=Polaribacter sp. KT25b TaxID=1855336 RepID=UPI00087C0E9B|nr:nuclear transport factor 2 family protein [Polaribacter sp. KT25b]SDR81436.1 SnoaL-like domain-containing protein [Polaribacter sp. KT25b]
MNANLETWHTVIFNQDRTKLLEILADDVVFHSPVVHTPQKGKQLTFMYLSAAFVVFFNDTFKYVREVVNETETLLEFEVEIDGILVNGIDMISWNDEGKITSFKVMLRPLKALNLIHAKMGEMLLKYQNKK